MVKTAAVSYPELLEAIQQECDAAGRVAAGAVAARLGKAEDEALERRIERELLSDGEFLHTETVGVFQRKRDWFADAEFLVTPNGFEIENGILVPGHRWAPFMGRDIFPSEVALIAKDSGKPVAKRSFKANADDILRCHILLGAEELYDFFVAESPDNAAVAAKSRNPELTLQVFDLKDFYAENEFSEGDALRVRVRSFDDGEFEFVMDDGKARTRKRRDDYRDRFETALLKVIEAFPGYLTITEQLQQTLIFGGRELLTAPAASLEEVIFTGSRVEIALDEDGSTLIARTEARDDACGDGDGDGCREAGLEGLPDMLGISAGETGSLEAMLRELKPVLTPVELESYMLDQCYREEYDFDSLCQRAFGEAELKFADEAQQVVFFTRLEERFEEFCEDYSHELDEPKAELRADILELCTLRRELFDELAELEIAPEKLPDAAVHELAEVALRLEKVLAMLNNPGFGMDEPEAATLGDAVEKALEIGEAAIGKIRSATGSSD